MHSKQLGRLVCCVCALGLFIDGYDLYISAIAEPFITQQFHPTPLMQGLIQAVAPLGAMTGAIIMGRVADKVGRKGMLVANLIFFVIIAVLSALAWDLPSLCLFRFFIGFGVGADYPIVAAYLAEMIEPSKRAKAMAFVMFVNCLASPVGALVAWGVFSLYPHLDAWRFLFALGAFPAMVGLALRARLPESLTWRAQQRLLAKEPKQYHRVLSNQYFSKTIALCACWFFMDIAYYGIGLFTPTILHALHISSGANFLENAPDVIRSTLFFNSFIMLGAFSVIFVIQRVNLVSLQKLGFAMGFAGMVCMAVNPSFAMVFFGFALFNFFINFGPGITTYYLPTVIYPPAIKATGHGLASGFGKLGAVVGTLFLPWLMHTLDIYKTLALLSLTLLIGYNLTNFLTDMPSIQGESDAIPVK
ncbi:MFS transporter [Legionella sp. W05-934-2]|jgi:putative MFS transporter|uniref:MFS transporter n=1 Tax=Legionella sp. W05-934-2 TaxID=1198649 RepID=UPI0034627CBF